MMAERTGGRQRGAGWGLVLSATALLSLLPPSVAPDISRETVHDDPFVVYPYRLTSSSPFGRIPDSALPGSQVPMDSTLPHFDSSQSTRYLRLQLLPNDNYLSQKERDHISSSSNSSSSNSSSSNSSSSNSNSSNNSSSSNNNSSSNNSSSNSIVHEINHKLRKSGLTSKQNKSSTGYKPSKGIWPGGSLLPEGVRIDISGEEGNVAKVNEKMAFTLDENLHIVVGNTRHFEEVDGIEFWVVAIHQEKGGPDRVVSNPLSFVIKVEHSQPLGHGAPVYAGVVVLVVCLFSLLIPLTVRTKRRLREGKPLCVCGSSSRELKKRRDKAAGRGHGVETVEEKVSGDWGEEQHNSLAMVLQGGLRAERVSRPRETFQSRTMRASTHLFQPRLLDPHYSDVYDRPVFKGPAPKIATRVTFAADSVDPSPATNTEDVEIKL